ncbi:SUN domain-containing ossification factor-like [Pollicipes pollicipes]|uniref:SUN domain-containing ossification factor-like n=1 Tax=Pollicipes pollicipes TaxID=41117 RepID=UPI001884D9FF|nr:SUN domain-containing ossification factor-like [Pollicipes pollicipes]
MTASQSSMVCLLLAVTVHGTTEPVAAVAVAVAGPGRPAKPGPESEPEPDPSRSPPHSIIDDTISRLQLSLQQLEDLKRGILSEDGRGAPGSTCASDGAPSAHVALDAKGAAPNANLERSEEPEPPPPPPPPAPSEAPGTPLPVPTDASVVPLLAPDAPAEADSWLPAPVLAPAAPVPQTASATPAATAWQQQQPTPEVALAPAGDASAPRAATVPDPGEPPPPDTGPPEPPVVIARDIRTLPSTPVPPAPPETEPGPETETAAETGVEAEAQAVAKAEIAEEATPSEQPPSDNGTTAAAERADGLRQLETGSGEEIQPFNEWASRRVEETQKKTGDAVSPSSGPGAKPAKKPPVRHRIKNYASPDCGAKVLAANPGATSAGNVLSPGRDEYMLNSCDTRVWFVVELCEGIQASRLELSNDELYSSSPREFAVYLTDRYPTREWSRVGQFTAEERRGPQTFHLPTVVFGKFVKVEILSNYGTHYYCTVSTLRVYGASEYEVLDHEDSENHSDETSEYEDLLEPAEPTDRPNLLNRALQAVNSMVQTAKVALTGQRDSDPVERCVSLDPRQLPANLSSEARAALGCRFTALAATAGGALFRRAERSCDICRPPEDSTITRHSALCGLARAILSPDAVQQVCAVRALTPPAPPVAAEWPRANGTVEPALAVEAPQRPPVAEGTLRQ